LELEINELNKRIDNYKKEFQDHRERSNKVILSTEENYKKLLNENESLKQAIDGLNNTVVELTIVNKELVTNKEKKQLSSSDLRILTSIKNKSLLDGKKQFK